MPNYRAMARRAAQRYGLDPNIFERQIKQESGFNPRARSPAGASGIAQIMPATAKSWGVDPMNPQQALNAAARNMASYVDKYGGYENALRAYNAGPGAIQRSKGFAETNSYVKTILGGRDPKRLGKPQKGGGGGGTRGGSAGLRIPGEAVNVAALLSSLQRTEQPRPPVTAPAAPSFSAGITAPQGYQPVPIGAPPARDDELKGALERIAELQDTLDVDTGQRGGKLRTTGATRRRNSGVNLSKGGGYAGTSRPVRVLAGLAGDYGLKTTSHKRPTVNTASGGVSDHYEGNKTADARDLAGSVPQMDNAAVAIARALGIKGYKKGKPLVETINRNGLRYQLLYRTNVGGDHFDHIHVGAARR